MVNNVILIFPDIPYLYKTIHLLNNAKLHFYQWKLMAITFLYEMNLIHTIFKTQMINALKVKESRQYVNHSNCFYQFSNNLYNYHHLQSICLQQWTDTIEIIYSNIWLHIQIWFFFNHAKQMGKNTCTHYHCWFTCMYICPKCVKIENMEQAKSIDMAQVHKTVCGRGKHLDGKTAKATEILWISFQHYSTEILAFITRRGFMPPFLQGKNYKPFLNTLWFPFTLFHTTH